MTDRDVYVNVTIRMRHSGSKPNRDSYKSCEKIQKEVLHSLHKFPEKYIHEIITVEAGSLEPTVIFTDKGSLF